MALITLLRRAVRSMGMIFRSAQVLAAAPLGTFRDLGALPELYDLRTLRFAVPRPVRQQDQSPR